MTIVDAGPQGRPKLRPRPFQFSLATALVVVTGASVALSLVMCHSTFGLMGAIVLVGGGWAAAARRAGYRTLAYFLAACGLGVIGHLVLAGLFLPFSGTRFLGEDWFAPLPVLSMSMATTVAAMLLRRVRGDPVMGGLAGVYLTAMIFPVLWGTFALVAGAAPWLATGRQLPEPAEGFVIVLSGCVGGAVMATITLPVTWPMGMLFCAILRRIDPVPEVWTEPGRDGWMVVHRDAKSGEGEWSGPLP